LILKIRSYKIFFPDSFESIQIKEFPITPTILNEKVQFEKYLSSLYNELPMISISKGAEHVELLVISNEIKSKHKDFNDIVQSTNAYLCKNKGASADFNILKNICERYLEKVDSGIGSLINVPLYIGLAGTFVGIIVGLSGINYTSSSGIIAPGSIIQLIHGVVAAMSASLIGLTLTVVVSVFCYRPGANKNDTDKNNYYDFLQQELLPFLNIGVSKSLGNFRDVLNHFIIRFGENMDDYKESGYLLNENLQRQQNVLDQINQLGLTATATKITTVFANLQESSQHLEKFQIYQKGLNNYVDKTEEVAKEINVMINNFHDFNMNLKIISDNIVSTLQLQKQFKDSLEKHFPIIEDHREIWRTHIDDLNNDVKEVYKGLHEYFKTSTRQIQNFVEDNGTFFAGINDNQRLAKIFVQNSEIQNIEFKALNNEMAGLRNDFKASQKQSIETNLNLIDVIKDLKIAIKEISIDK
jgi:biopolymer transport protein ExbB/TolQ